MKTERKLWVKAKEIKAATGWDKEQMRKARMYGWMEWKKDKEKGFIYNLNSIPEQLIKQSA